MNLIGDEFGMEYLAIFIFWCLISALILWLIYTVINNSLKNKTHFRKNKSQKINEVNYSRGEEIQKENGKKSKY